MSSHLHHDQPRKTRLQFDLTPQQLALYFHLPQREAARQLHMAEITLKRICKRAQVRWPYRAQKAAIARAQRQRPTSSARVALTTINGEDEDTEAETDKSQEQDQDRERTMNSDVEDGQKDADRVRRRISSLSLGARQPAAAPVVTLAPTLVPMSAAAIVFARLPELCKVEHLE